LEKRQTGDEATSAVCAADQLREMDFRLHALLYDLEPLTVYDHRDREQMRHPLKAFLGSRYKFNRARLLGRLTYEADGTKHDYWTLYTPPHYSTRLNACAEAEKRCIERFGWDVYEGEMENAWYDSFWRADGNPVMPLLQWFATAPPEARCRAMIRCATEEK